MQHTKIRRDKRGLYIDVFHWDKVKSLSHILQDCKRKIKQGKHMSKSPEKGGGHGSMRNFIDSTFFKPIPADNY